MTVETQNPPTYVREIDGLRALAVLSVMLFHLDHKLLPGGFSGVDVFFVISGYVVNQPVKHGRDGFKPDNTQAGSGIYWCFMPNICAHVNDALTGLKIRVCLRNWLGNSLFYRPD